MTTAAKTAAHAAGRKAFLAGSPRRPVAGTVDEMRSWVSGWDHENLRADVPEWTAEENDAMRAALDAAPATDSEWV